MKKVSLSPLARRIIVWGVSAGFFGGFIYLVIRTKTYVLLKQLDPLSISVLIGVSFVYILESILATQVLLRGMGYAVSYSSLYWVLTTSAFANETSPGPVGVPVRLLLCKKLFGIPFSASTANVAVESGLGIATGSVIAVIGVLHLFQSMVSNFGVLLLIAMGGIALGWGLQHAASSKVHEKYFWGRYLSRLLDFVGKMKLSIQMVSWRTLLVFWLLLVVRIIIRVLVTYAVLLYFGYHLSPWVVLYIQSITSLIAMASMIPVGLGVKEISVVALLAQVGVPGDLATLVALAERVMWTLVPFAVGLVSINRLGTHWLNREDTPPAV
jgi:uncharacterized protein (TIRG00374 family)